MHKYNLTNVSHVLIGGRRLPVHRRWDNGNVLVSAPSDFTVPHQHALAMHKWPAASNVGQLYSVNVAGLPLIRS